ncbi:DC-STAMP domain-containing protein 2-like [Mytilus californianus]|uniref:DC-STAMP domain-containing protein 2-like n=1 Tax=Mytilus californianus TaxID=6549 RepID=UPI0022473D79|nr:DC-STAMP domain-containing protein 2-like [Mytilus californianus]XP_052064077.1 DC-STAMP domain-containing protein 2-like [Mytilus californianus]
MTNVENKPGNLKLRFEETKSDDPSLINDAVTFPDKLFKSERHTFTCLKAIFGIFCGILTGGILFVLLVFSFGFDLDMAGYISIGVTALACLGLALSVHVRCIMVLMIPSLFTGRGRVAILAVIFGLLLSGPIKNISINTSEVSRSMACSTELFHNQSHTLRQQLNVPIEQIKDALGKQAQDIKKIGKEIEKAIAPIYDALVAVKKGVKLVSGALDTASQECDRMMNRVYDDCVSDLNKAYSVCTNTLRDVKRYVPFLDLTAVCKVLDIDKVCVVVKPSFVCSPVKSLDNAAEKLAESVVSLVKEVDKWFQFNIINQSQNGKVYNASKTAREFIADIEEALTDKKITFTNIVGFLSKLLALSLLLLLTQSFFYLKNYLAKDEFDNIYISSHFKGYDSETRKKGQQGVLPLQKKEKKLYTDSTSLRMSPKEKSQSLMGISQLFLHVLLSALIVFLNYVLFYILFLVNRYGQVNVEVTGQSKINLKVKGGQMAAFINTFINNINIENTYEASYNTTLCLPSPTAPDATDIPVLCSAYIAALLLVFMQAYGARYNRKICAFYYPEQEKERIVFLQKQILYNRKRRHTFIKQHVTSIKKQKIAEQRMSVKQTLSAICPCFKVEQTDLEFCMNCGANQGSSHTLKACKNTNCSSTYCSECFDDFGHTCPICSK